MNKYIDSVRIIRSNRKTLGIELTANGEIIARAPLKMKNSEIYDFIEKKSGWIENHLEKINKSMQNTSSAERFTREEIEEMAEKALKIIPERVKYYAPLIGVSYGRITIRNQKTRWGSCSSSGNLNFNCLMMLTPPEVIDSVVVHELCHRKEMNHSKEFYNEVLKVFPDYYKWNDWLKENGRLLLKRMFG